MIFAIHYKLWTLYYWVQVLIISKINEERFSIADFVLRHYVSPREMQTRGFNQDGEQVSKKKKCLYTFSMCEWFLSKHLNFGWFKPLKYWYGIT